MLRRRVTILLFVLIALVIVSLALTTIVSQRANQDRIYSLNNLRELGHFAMLAARPDDLRLDGPGKTIELERLKGLPVVDAIPAGTVMLAGVPPERRLSWVATAIPYLNQQRQDSLAIQRDLKLDKPWDDQSNQTAATSVIRSLIPTTITPPADGFAPTHYVGVGGIGPGDAATKPASDPQAGCFRYDSSTPFAAIDDGLRTSILFAESAMAAPWLQGGPGTVRTLDADRPAMGPAGQFGGIHRGFSCFGYADGSAGILTDRISPAVLRSLCTIRGRETLVGE